MKRDIESIERGKRIKEARAKNLLTQQQLADKMNKLDYGNKITRHCIAQWETGATKEISASFLLKACKILNADPHRIIFG